MAENAPKWYIIIGTLAICATKTVAREMASLFGKNLNSFAVLFPNASIESTTANDSWNPTKNNCIGNKINRIDNAVPIELNPSYRSPERLDNSKIAHIIVALSDDAEKPHTPE